MTLNEVVYGLRDVGRYKRGACPRCGKDSFLYSPRRNQFHCFCCNGHGKGEIEFADFMDWEEMLDTNPTVTSGPFDLIIDWFRRKKDRR